MLIINILLFTSDEHSTKVKSFMLDILCPLICESDMVASELLDIILINIVEPNKSQRKNAYSLAKDLILKCSNTLEPYIQSVYTYIKLQYDLYFNCLLFILVFQSCFDIGKE